MISEKSSLSIFYLFIYFFTFVAHLTLGCTRKTSVKSKYSLGQPSNLSNLDKSCFKQEERSSIELPRKNLTHAILVSATL